MYISDDIDDIFYDQHNIDTIEDLKYILNMINNNKDENIEIIVKNCLGNTLKKPISLKDFLKCVYFDNGIDYAGAFYIEIYEYNNDSEDKIKKLSKFLLDNNITLSDKAKEVIKEKDKLLSMDCYYITENFIYTAIERWFNE